MSKEKDFTIEGFLSDCSKELKNANVLSEIPDFKIMPSCISGLNRAFGPMAGLPLSRFTVIHGPNSAGKSALALLVAKDFQDAGHFVVYIDAEHTLEKKWPKELGIDPNKLFVIRPDHFQDAAQELDGFFKKYFALDEKIREQRWVCVIVDTLAKLEPKENLFDKKDETVQKANTGVGKAQGYPLQALLIRQWFGKLTPIVGKHNIALVILQQERVKMEAQPFEEQYVLPGGQALQFDNSMRIRVELTGNIKDGDTKERLGKEHRLTIKKSKIGVDNEIAYFYTSTGRGEDEIGFDAYRTVMKEAKIQEVVKNSGAQHTCYLWPDEKWNGEAKFRKWLKENPDEYKKLVNELNTYWQRHKSCCLVEEDVPTIDPEQKPPDLIDDEKEGIQTEIKNPFKRKKDK